MTCDRERSVAERVYRLMLLAYAPAFRLHYGQEMLQAFRQGQRERCQSDGLKGLLRFWFLILFDWVGSSLLRYVFPTIFGLAFVVCWIVFGGPAPTKSGHGSSAVTQLMLPRSKKWDTDAIHSGKGSIAKRMARVRSNNLHVSVGRHAQEFDGPSFALAGPPALAGKMRSAEFDSQPFKLIGEASVKQARGGDPHHCRAPGRLRSCKA